ncbi:hypothetical protein QQ020_29645 [Fulvivirgaceae bacterium BMA12]|uniref:Uncharacterized protein n=1 Tax=Agaribacillus aureus TaxID=3051825 RepID=A0ABT8LEQ5_9BACT|nr:hypothetical protein [Fulvivirgaceae bacterium BMA12]
MTRKNFWLGFVFFFAPLAVLGQRTNYQSGWNPGVLVLADNSIVKGEINYIQKKENVIVTSKNKKTTYHASSIKYFQFYDKKLKYNRAFTALSRKPDSPPSKMQVFEIVLEGALPYYRKPVLVEKVVVKRDKAGSSHVMDDFVEYVYFLKTEDRLIQVKNFGTDVLPHMKKHIREISNFMEENKLNITLVSDQIQIIDKYNALEENLATKKGID